MKKLTLIFITILLFMIIGCSSDDSSGDTTGIGGIGGTGGTGGTGNVTIQVQGQAGNDGNYYFYINPSVAITLTSVIVTLAGSGSETIDMQNTQFQANNSKACVYYPQNYGTSGSKWTFEFKGTLTSGGEAFDVTTTYTIP